MVASINWLILSLIWGSCRRTVWRLNHHHAQHVEMICHIFSGYLVSSGFIHHIHKFLLCKQHTSILERSLFATGSCDWTESNVSEVAFTDAVVYVKVTKHFSFLFCAYFSFAEFFRYRQQFMCMYKPFGPSPQETFDATSPNLSRLCHIRALACMPSHLCRVMLWIESSFWHGCPHSRIHWNSLTEVGVKPLSMLWFDITENTSIDFPCGLC